MPCNRRDNFVIEVHVKPGLPSEIYADRENKVCMHCLEIHLFLSHQFPSAGILSYFQFP